MFLNRLVVGLFLLFSLVNAAMAAEEDRIVAVVTIPPQRFLVERIGRGKIETLVLVPPGADPHVYEPTPRQLTLFSRARVYFKIGSGIEFERAWLGKLRSLNRKLTVRDTSSGIALLSSSGCHSHSSEKNDSHVWLSPRNFARMAENIAVCLAEIDPGNRDFYLQNARKLQAELSVLHEEISSLLAPHQGGAFLVFHPAWAYFAAEYGLTEIAIEDEGKEPSARRLKELIDQARRQNIKTIFVSPQFSAAAAAAVAREIGAGLIEYAQRADLVTELDPLAEDYPANLKKAAHLLDENFRR